MITIKDVRAKFPQYADLSDDQLADALHRRYYADLSPDQFRAKIGMGQQDASPATGVSPPPDAPTVIPDLTEPAMPTFEDRIAATMQPAGVPPVSTLSAPAPAPSVAPIPAAPIKTAVTPQVARPVEDQNVASAPQVAGNPAERNTAPGISAPPQKDTSAPLGNYKPEAKFDSVDDFLKKGTISGYVGRVLDGDTFEISGKKVRLAALDCPEGNRFGGAKATALVTELTKDVIVTCELDGTTTYDRLVGYCAADGQDIGQAMIDGQVCGVWEKFDSKGRYLGSYQGAEMREDNGKGVVPAGLISQRPVDPANFVPTNTMKFSASLAPGPVQNVEDPLLAAMRGEAVPGGASNGLTPAMTRAVSSRDANDLRPPSDPFEGEGFGPLAKRRGQQVARGAAEVVASVPEAAAIMGENLDRRRDVASDKLLPEAEALEAEAAALEAQLSEIPPEALGPEDRAFALEQAKALRDRAAQRRLLAQTPTVTAPTVPAQERSVFAAGDRIRGAVADTVGSPDPRDAGFWAKVAEGGGNMAGMIAASTAGGLVGGPAGSVIMGGATGSAMNQSQVFKEALDAGADQETALQASKWAAVIGAGEIIPINRALKILPPRLRGELTTGFLRKFVDVAQAAGEEAAQEYLAQVANNITAQKLYDPERGWTEGATDAALVGAVLGAGVGGIGLALEGKPAAQNVTAPPRREEPPADPLDQITAAMQPPTPAPAALTVPRPEQAAPAADTKTKAKAALEAFARAAQGAAIPVGSSADSQFRALISAAERAGMTSDEIDAALSGKPQPSQGDGGRYEILDEVENGPDGKSRPTGRKVRYDRETGTVSPLPEQTPAEAGGAPGGADSAGGQPQANGAPVVGQGAPPAAASAPGSEVPQAPSQIRNQPEDVVFLDGADVQQVQTDAATFQYKDGGDSDGVTDRLRGVTKWDTARAGMAIIYERADGTRVIADGHQRLGLAKRLAAEGQPVRMPAIVMREVDGVSPQEARAAAAFKNIAEGSGTATDAAKVLRDTDTPAAELGLPPNSALVRDALGLRNLSDDAFGMVVNGVATEAAGGLVGRIVQNKELHRDILGLLARLKPANAFQAEAIVRQAMDATTTETQTSLFGDEEVQANLYLERAKILDGALKRVRDDLKTFKTLVTLAEKASAAGNVLNATANQSKLDADTALRDYLGAQANMKGPISDALTEAARAYRADKRIGPAIDAFLANLERAMAPGGGDGQTRNPSGQTDSGKGGGTSQAVSPTSGILAAMGAKPTPETEATPAGQQAVGGKGGGVDPPQGDKRDENAADSDLFGGPAPDPQAQILAAMTGRKPKGPEAPGADPAPAALPPADPFAPAQTGKTPDQVRAEAEAAVRAQQSKLRKPDGNSGDAGPLFNPDQDLFDPPKEAAKPKPKSPTDKLADEIRARQAAVEAMQAERRAILAYYTVDGDEAIDKANAFVDLAETPSGEALMARLIEAKTFAEKKAVADAFVLDEGKRTGVEHLVVLTESGIPLAITSGHKSGVSFPAAVWRAGSRGEVAYSVHNHPSSNGFSGSDLAIPAIWPKHTLAIIGHNGDRHEVRATRDFDMVDDATLRDPMIRHKPLNVALTEAREGALWRINKHMLDKGEATAEGEARYHAAARPFFHLVLERMGLIRYTDRAKWLAQFEAQGFNFEDFYGQVSGAVADRLGRAGWIIPEGRDTGGNRPAGEGPAATPPRTDGAAGKPAPNGGEGDGKGRVPAQGLIPASKADEPSFGNADIDGALDDVAKPTAGLAEYADPMGEGDAFAAQIMQELAQVDDLGNIQSLIDASVANLIHQVPEVADARYDFESRTFRTGEGKPLTDGDLDQWASAAAGNRKTRVGRATLKRGILLNTLARAESGERPGLLERSLRQSRQLVERGGLRRIFYQADHPIVKDADAATDRIAAMMPKLRAELDRLDLKRVKLAMDSGSDWQGMFQVTGDGAMEITIAASLDPMKTLHHEVIHALRSLDLFTLSEWRALELAAERGWIEKHDIAARYPDLLPHEQIEEAIAEEFSEALAVKKSPKGSALVTAFNKIARLLRALRNVLNGAGYQTAEDIFGRILAGEISKRQAGNLGERATKGQRKQQLRIPSRQTRAHLATAMGGESAFIPDRRMWEELSDAGKPIWDKISGAGGAVSDAIDRARFAIQDRFLPVLRAQEAVMRATGKPLTADQNAYLAETTFSGRVGRRLFEIDEEVVRPIIDMIAETNGELTVDQVGQWLYARHAEERNQQIAAINDQMPDGGSGMSNAEAGKILRDSAAGPHAIRLEKIGAMIDRLREKTITMRLDAGLISEAEADVWRKTYKHYVPLRGFSDSDHSEASLDVTGIGRRFNIRGDESKRALGRKSEAFNPLQAAITQAQEVAIRAEKNRVANAVFELAKSYPSKGLWEVKPVVEKRYFNKTSGMVETRAEHPISMMLQPNEMAVKVAGKEHRIILRDERLAEAIGNMGADQLQGVVKVLGPFSRFFSAVNTSLSPAFVIKNAIRDFTSAQINMAALKESKAAGFTLTPKQRAAIMAGMARDWRKAFMGVMRGQGYKFDTEWSKHFEEFQKSGAQVWFWRMEDPQAAKGDMEKRVRLTTGSAAVRAAKNLTTPSAFFSSDHNVVLGAVERVNMATDNAIRLAAFVAARKQGLSADQAAFMSKELTVNFNRRGKYGAALNAVFPFFNASVQGSTRLLQALSNWKMSVGLTLGGAGLGMVMDLVNAALSDDDDDGEKLYDKIPDYRNRTNQHIVSGNGSTAWAIPLPYGYNIFMYGGQQLGKVMRGVKDGDDAFADVAVATAESYMPTDSLMPGILQPYFEITVNENFFGSAIYPEKWGKEQFLPDAANYFPSASEASRWLAMTLNKASGGSELKSGHIDMSPETIDHYMAFVVGGAGRFWGNNIDNLAKVLKGKAGEIETKNIPFVGVVRSEVSPWIDKDRFRRFGLQVEDAEADMKALSVMSPAPSAGYPGAIAGRFAMFDEMVGAEKRPLLALIEPWKRANREINGTGEFNPNNTRGGKYKFLRPSRPEREVMLEFNALFLKAAGHQAE